MIKKYFYQKKIHVVHTQTMESRSKIIKVPSILQTLQNVNDNSYDAHLFGSVLNQMVKNIGEISSKRKQAAQFSQVLKSWLTKYGKSVLKSNPHKCQVFFNNLIKMELESDEHLFKYQEIIDNLKSVCLQIVLI